MTAFRTKQLENTTSRPRAALGGRSAARSMDRPATLTVAVTGASGLIGQALCDSLTGNGLSVIRLVRGDVNDQASQCAWNPDERRIDLQALDGVDAVVHLAGENIASGRWTQSKKQEIRSSRVDGTRFLCEALAKLKEPPETLICASAIGFYGDRGTTIVTEEDEAGTGFLADVCRDWEQATKPASEAGIRVVNLRLGVVLASAGGAVAKMIKPFRWGLGGKLGDGKQYMSWIAIEDVVNSIRFAILHDAIEGPVNAVSPQPVTNGAFTKALSRVVNRPALFPVPRFMLRLFAGEMADALLLASTRVYPEKLLHHGFRFEFSKVERALEYELNY